MKILILSDDFPPVATGGAGVAAYRISQEFAKQGHMVHVVTASNDREKCGTKQMCKITVTCVFSPYSSDRWRSYRSLYNPGVMEELKAEIIKFKPDIVHAHIVHLYLSYYSLVVAKRYAKVYLTAHDIMSFYPGTFTEFINPKDFSIPSVFNYKVSFLTLLKKFRLRYNPFRNILIRHCLSRITRVITVSNALGEALSQNGIKNAIVIHNGINVSEWNISPTEAEEFRKTCGLAESKIILFQGRLSGAKGGDLILQAMQEVAHRTPSAKLLVVGRKDSYAERMEKKAKSLGLGDRVVFVGWLSEEEMKKAYASATLVVVPSACFDSFPNGNLEAFASARPVVSTCFGGSREIVKDGENGFIVNPFNVAKLADAIVDLLSGKEKAHKFGEAGRRLVAEKYSIEEVAKKYLLLFRE